MSEEDIAATVQQAHMGDKVYDVFDMSYQEVDNEASAITGNQKQKGQDENINQYQNQLKEQDEGVGQKEEEGDEDAQQRDEMVEEVIGNGHTEQHPDQEHEQIQQQQQDGYTQQDYELVENLQQGDHEYHDELHYEETGEGHYQEDDEQNHEYMMGGTGQGQTDDMDMQGILSEHSGVEHTLAAVPTSTVEDVQAAHEAASHVLSSFTQSYATGAAPGTSPTIVQMNNGSHHHQNHSAQGSVNNVLDVKTLTPKFNRGRNWSRDEATHVARYSAPRG